ncbi:MAG: lactate utilization protein [bacterium]|nr:lactate utilization protein [bacterium]
MNSRDKILARLRATPRPAECAPAHRLADRAIYHDCDGGSEELIARFGARLTQLQGEFHRAADVKAAAEVLLRITDDSAGGRCIAHAHPLIRSVLDQNERLAEGIELPDPGTLDSPDFAQYEIGITAADYLVARTGGIVLHAAGAGGRRMSVLPPFHIVLARRDQVVSSLDEALARIRETSSGSGYGTIITGPSRTGDIEKIIILGAHGPKRLAVVLIG